MALSIENPQRRRHIYIYVCDHDGSVFYCPHNMRQEGKTEITNVVEFAENRPTTKFNGFLPVTHGIRNIWVCGGFSDWHAIRNLLCGQNHVQPKARNDSNSTRIYRSLAIYQRTKNENWNVFVPTKRKEYNGPAVLAIECLLIRSMIGWDRRIWNEFWLEIQSTQVHRLYSFVLNLHTYLYLFMAAELKRNVEWNISMCVCLTWLSFPSKMNNKLDWNILHNVLECRLIQNNRRTTMFDVWPCWWLTSNAPHGAIIDK